MTKINNLIASFSLILFTGFIACGKSSKTQTTDPKNQDTIKTDSTTTDNGGGKLEISTKNYIRYTAIKNPEIDYCDSSRVEMDIVEVKCGDKGIQDKINEAIIKSITTKESPTIDALLHSNDKAEYGTYLVIEMKSLFSDDKVLSVKVYQVDQECESQAMTGTTLLNFDLKSGEFIKFSDLISKEDTKKFEKIAGEAFIAKYKKEDFDIKKPTDFKANGKFSISNQGITFFFDKYEIGAGSSGESEILVPYAKFKDLIIAESIISKY